MRTTTHILLCLLLLFYACGKEDTETNYYRFTEEDRNYIISHNYQNGDVLTYKNQHNQSLQLRVVESKTTKAKQTSKGTFSGGGGLFEAYYDRKIIRLEMVNNEADNDETDEVIYVFSKRENTFTAGIRFPLWNKFSAAFVDQINTAVDLVFNVELNHKQETINLNNKTFKKVVQFDSNLNDAYNDSSNIEIYVNQIFYDLEFGIIQFVDIDGKTWKLDYS